MRLTLFLAAGALLPLAGCHSPFIQATVINATSDPIPLVEVDYPSASFGASNLAPGATFRTRFKVLGSGPTAVLWTDAAHHDHKSPGPTLHEGDEGTLTLTFTPQGPTWTPTLTHR